MFIVIKKHKLDLCVSAEHIFQERFCSIRNLIYVVFLMPNKITLFVQICSSLMELRKDVFSDRIFKILQTSIVHVEIDTQSTNKLTS